MGEHDVERIEDGDTRSFTKALLEDVLALERMLEGGLIEAGVRRIGAEQEMFLVGRAMDAAPIAVELLERARDERLTTELARFNLEANLSPVEFGGGCLSALERELREVVTASRRAAQSLGADVLLTGILPTLRQRDLGLENMTPAPRYHELNRALRKMRGNAFHVLISGVDEFEMKHDNVMLESCNTSFQIHFQVGAEEFARLYNLAQVVTAPVLAAAVNSPVLLRKRLWSETRVALFERSVDTRGEHRMQRPYTSRVYFGDGWVRDSVLDVVRKDVARFRSVLATRIEENPLQVLEQGGIPQLRALRLHTGTIYRWNRACYGLTDGKPHLRIENRVLPAGPTIVDEMANAAFFFGLMASLGDAYAQIDAVMDFDDAKANFLAAGRHGLRAQFTWVDGRTVTAADLILHEFLPAARDGLSQRGIDSGDIDRYLGVMEERVKTARTGARWILDSLAKMGTEASADARYRTLTRRMLSLCHGDLPIHDWPLATLDDQTRPLKESIETVGQFMSTELFTVHAEDIIDLAATVMDWEHVRHVPVEDEQGHLLGLVSHRQLLRLVARGGGSGEDRQLRVRDVMAVNPVTVAPDTPTLEAIALMRDNKISCLPVVEEHRLVGILTERDLINVAAKLLEEFLTTDEGVPDARPTPLES